ncbi:hypothetical protein RvY_05600-2 [Ramazzottius varieornatus]|uniref:Uncharacterized protein n=1 Tax=Ramazzottius varieornatus TaxID=947166 RepID=A0A1D1V167_RAMVA|nr:hypothetical protein RvY_05600-2 [Ramazzottius varieornatus]
MELLPVHENLLPESETDVCSTCGADKSPTDSPVDMSIDNQNNLSCGLRARHVRRTPNGNATKGEKADLESSSEEESSSDESSSDAENILDDIKQEGKAAIAAGKEMLHDASDKAQEVIRKVWEATPFSHLPDWLKDNDYLHSGHRPQIESFAECFRSIFSIHTETGNIWTHLIGCILFIGIAVYFFLPAEQEFPAGEKWAFAAFFAGAIVCMGFSFLYHTLYCHSERVGLVFGKLDYCGISLLILGSFVPWLHYSFYCHQLEKYTYIGIISVLSTSCIVVSLWNKFSEPAFRPIRAFIFSCLGASGVVPTLHYTIANGWEKSVNEGSLYWILTMGALYLLGALCYAARVPERWYPGQFDIWFHSHQIFHVLVVLAALIHYQGVMLMANNRYDLGSICPNPAEDVHPAPPQIIL